MTIASFVVPRHRKGQALTSFARIRIVTTRQGVLICGVPHSGMVGSRQTPIPVIPQSHQRAEFILPLTFEAHTYLLTPQLDQLRAAAFPLISVARAMN